MSTASASSSPGPARGNLKPTLVLLVVTVIWGWTFVWNKQVMVAIDEVLGPEHHAFGVGLFLALRFGLAALTMPLWPAARHGLNRRSTWSGGFVLGALLAVGFAFQMFGLAEVDPAVSAFLTSLYVVFTALIGRLRGQRVGVVLWIGVLLATAGAAWIDGPPQVSFGLGEWLTVASALTFAFHIVATDHITKRAPPLALSTTTFVWVCAGATAMTIAVWPYELAPGEAWQRAWLLLQHPGFYWPLLLTCFIATNLALSLMNLFQRELAPVRAAILYALEPVWAAICGMLVGSVSPNPWLFVGGTTLFMGNLISEMGPRLLVEMSQLARRTPTIPPSDAELGDP